MVGIPGLYFVVACDEFARFVRPDADDGLHTIEVVDSLSIGDRDDPAGPPPTSARFARLLAAVIEEDLAVDLFTHLVLVAPPDLLRELRANLSPAAHANLIGSLAKDLAIVPDLELWPHLLPWLQPPNSLWAPATFLKEP